MLAVKVCCQPTNFLGKSQTEKRLVEADELLTIRLHICHNTNTVVICTLNLNTIGLSKIHFKTARLVFF